MNEEIKELKRKQKTKTLLSYADWLENQPKSEQNKDLFSKDIEYKNFFFIQSNIDREIYLRELWLKNRNSRIESLVGETKSTNKYKEDFITINRTISNTIRSIRNQIDKYLLKNKQKPVFGHNIRFYDKEEILYDAEINFHQIKKFLSSKTDLLKQDETISKRYLELMELLTRKKILENSVAKFEKPEFFDHENKVYWDRMRGVGAEGDNIGGKVEDVDDSEMKEYLKSNFGEGDEVDADYASSLMSGEGYLDVVESKLSVDEGNILDREKRLKEKLLEHFEGQMKEAFGVKSKKSGGLTKEKLDLKKENKGSKKGDSGKGGKSGKDKTGKKIK